MKIDKYTHENPFCTRKSDGQINASLDVIFVINIDNI